MCAPFLLRGRGFVEASFEYFLYCCYFLYFLRGFESNLCVFSVNCCCCCCVESPLCAELNINISFMAITHTPRTRPHGTDLMIDTIWKSLKLPQITTHYTDWSHRKWSTPIGGPRAKTPRNQFAFGAGFKTHFQLDIVWNENILIALISFVFTHSPRVIRAKPAKYFNSHFPVEKSPLLIPLRFEGLTRCNFIIHIIIITV